MQRDTCVQGILNELFCLQWYSLNPLNTDAKEVGLASEAGGPEAKEKPFSDCLQKNILRFATTFLCTKHLCDHICAPVSPALLAEVRLPPQTNSSVIC